MKQLTHLITFCLFSTVSWAVCVEGDCLHGRGTYTWPSGAKHVGNWKDGIRNGQGTYTWLGAKYVGQWRTTSITVRGLTLGLAARSTLGNSRMALETVKGP